MPPPDDHREPPLARRVRTAHTPDGPPPDARMVEYDSDDGRFVCRRGRDRRPDRTVWLLTLVPVAVVSLAGLALVTIKGVSAVRAAAEPSATREGESWNYAELADYLKAKGVPVVMGPRKRGPGVLIAVDQRTLDNSTEIDAAGASPLMNDGVIDVTKYADPAELKDLTSRETDGTAFAWGRFFFSTSDAGYLSKVRQALR